MVSVRDARGLSEELRPSPPLLHAVRPLRARVGGAAPVATVGEELLSARVARAGSRGGFSDRADGVRVANVRRRLLAAYARALAARRQDSASPRAPRRAPTPRQALRRRLDYDCREEGLGSEIYVSFFNDGTLERKISSYSAITHVVRYYPVIKVIEQTLAVKNVVNNLYKQPSKIDY